MHSKMSFGNRVRTLREKSGISLNKMARTLEVSAGYLSNLESGKTENVTVHFLESLQQNLGLNACLICGQKKESALIHDLEPELQLRIQRIQEILFDMAKSNPKQVEYLLGLLECGLGGMNREDSVESPENDLPRHH
ncbi:helix-turn-helix transcriptional regulator [Heliorestis acidaminivorans]|uniref:Helix-turn-helix transcriptional regulator n=1 Tax=Heliorestis acidaminivorans TaxID=553427 RepID=A0A6I0ERA0_9FIRM|nr:helix-turn-helix transcriptional regulator [Heliorestis acidaminivorans]KAB2951160.1 helix-turn-helix transcriptional regulator [Heliorestis acidaminivorans]